ncbi:MAG: hypothetical protein KatS3mg115_1082 [Candidatus Poribacteria bacterium]|nr:MAG: hypothetical protein KatS3mg115_1082 [Candidatus Poribacteria bacterium]
MGRARAVGLFAAGMLASFAVAQDVEIALEAELASEIVAPMVVATADDAAQFGPRPTDPSRGQFIWAPGPPATGGGGAGYARWIVEIPKEDVYAIWGRVVAWDGNSDSFWVTVSPPDEDPNPQQSQDTHFRWSVTNGPDWHWDRIDQWLDAGTFLREWELPQGEVVITIWVREDATMLDALFITNNLSPDVALVNPRLPTDEEVEKQLGGLAVRPAGKLTTAWGQLKVR